MHYIQSLAARLYDQLIKGRMRVLCAATGSCIAATVVKYALTGTLVREGLSPHSIRFQDALTTGVLAGALTWTSLALAYFRREQIRSEVDVIWELNHHLRNALAVILHSQYLPEAAQGKAILQSVERIDTMLQRIVPDSALRRTDHRAASIPDCAVRHDRGAARRSS